ncbi:hypothetical protein ACJ73_02997 [Blastomyces percursus]|uniref:Uncharacterized protein n=1 Tax=Blastomyces percursus TaxID=1658174 RepID=A0A1J9QAR5_9EURO|nr:hypothetical protein ACJ73_02997 [Blastomyces percursus]
MTTCALEFCEAAAALGKPWKRIDGDSYNREEIYSRGNLISKPLLRNMHIKVKCCIIFQNWQLIWPTWLKVFIADDGMLTSMEEQYETSSCLSPSVYDDAEMYFVEFCKAILIIKKRVPEDVDVASLMRICMDNEHTLQLVTEHLRAVAHCLECHSSSEGQQVPSNRWYILVARAQNLWKSDVQKWPGLKELSWEDYLGLIREIGDEFHLRE